MMTFKDLKIRLGKMVHQAKFGYSEEQLSDREYTAITNEWCQKNKTTLTKLKPIALAAAKANDPKGVLKKGIDADSKLVTQLSDMDGVNLYEDLTELFDGHTNVQQMFLKNLAKLV